ncbi:uncharacterized protein LOC111280418 [Durio zibethinus]|uniref:Uncharacterized protein LOC111280418 n=1 Tax=Durio zibethinus TaxID=66656 RepID=A0A6P5X577_DURZI|nr:uncharacterized protein LOC111280418 [Durio zibethinus]
MGSECNPSNKLHYDITMSKRTRKPLNLQEKAIHQNSHTTASIFDQSSPSKGDHHEEELESDRKSLKQLINGDEKAISRSGSSCRSSTSLGHHFTEEEKQLQLVKKNQQDNGLKLKGMMSRYAKVLSHLVKLKRESRKKHLLRLTM